MPPPLLTDTIFALATAPQPAAIAVIRLSGDAVPGVLQRLTGGLPRARQASLRRLCHPDTGQLLDHALMLYFPAPHSYTGEAVAELQLHGGRAVVDAVLACLAQQPGCRQAEPGEFTKRAFLNDKMDLLAAEAIADLTAAETEQQRQLALAASNHDADGGDPDAPATLSGQIAAWSQQLLHSLAYVEAALDFPDEDLPQDLIEQVRPAISQLAKDMTDLLTQSALSEEIREGFRIALVGAPNVGKSSLLNQLAGRSAAIVSAQAGTTRDVVEVRLNLNGYLVILADTAGVRPRPGQLEGEGIRRTRAWAQTAQLRIFVTAPPLSTAISTALSNAVSNPLPAALQALRQPHDLLVLNKADLLANQPHSSPPQPAYTLTLSAKTGLGITDLLTLLQQQVQQRYHNLPSHSLSRARQRRLVERSADHLHHSLTAPTAEIMAEELRLALRSLGELLGKVDVDQLLDVIFRDFCLGK
ncbi:MAG: tRNA uridine-5-carboxymethylaminomethyl(34) synthesis GTPase MnmE [Alphaproteobacteria bacterium]|nr:tRNA uridine-5-carboxymethylaminomethyl(34) synthesis GTPase MnmE [Alphaproteobacteria bacterium]